MTVSQSQYPNNCSGFKNEYLLSDDIHCEHYMSSFVDSGVGMSGRDTDNNSAFLIVRMLEGWDWFDNRLRSALLSHGYRAFSKTQTMLIVYVASGFDKPADIARRMNLSRQAILHIAHELVAAGIFEIHRADDDPRAFKLVFSSKMKEARTFASDVLKELERRLERKIGSRNLKIFRELHALAWAELGNEGRRAAPSVLNLVVARSQSAREVR